MPTDHNKGKFTERYFEELAHKIYSDLMEKEEIEQMLDGKDFWFSSQEVFDRLKKTGREILGSESDAIPFNGESQDAESVQEFEVVQTPPKKTKSAKK